MWSGEGVTSKEDKFRVSQQLQQDGEVEVDILLVFLLDLVDCLSIWKNRSNY